HGRRRAPMAGDAAAAQLWGISGPAFLAGYLAAEAAVLATALVLRLLAGRGPQPSRQPDPVQLAYLNGGRRLAIYAALAALRSTDAVAAGPGGRLGVDPGQPAPAGELEWAVYTAAMRGARQRDLAPDTTVATALRRMRAAPR